MNIFEALRNSHDTQRAMADSLSATHEDSPERELLFKALRAEVSAVHAAAEERFFYMPLMTHDMTQEPSRHGIAEHHEMEEMVETLEKTDHSSSAWLVTAKELSVFQLAGKVLSEAEKLLLAKGYEGEFVSQRSKA